MTRTYCPCFRVRTPTEALQDLADEIVEFIQGPSADEASDIAFATGRLIASLLKKVYYHVPGDAKHVAKINQRMADHGCIRSQKHAVQHQQERNLQ